MAQELCLLHANCQGRPLAQLLLASPEFSARWQVRGVVNYRREPLSDADLSAATLFVYQNLTAKWEVLASENVLRRLSPSAMAVCVPNPWFKGYWPLWIPRDEQGRDLTFGDQFLERLLGMDLSATDILHLYLHTPLTKKFDLQALLEKSLEVEARRETPCDFKTLPWVLERWRQERVFLTINHPGPALLRFMADEVLRKIGMAPLTDANLAAAGLNRPGAVCCDAVYERRFEQPIHPQVAAFFGLEFVNADMRYQVFDASLSFEQYVTATVVARQDGVPLFTTELS